MTRPSLTDGPDLPRRAIALVLAGGRGTRLMQLTENRAEAAVHFGGKFRIVDFALSNCMNSGIRRVGVITQYNSHSLLRHLQRGWAFLKREMYEFVDLLPAQQQIHEKRWYQGTADAVHQNRDILSVHDHDYVVVLAGDHVYRMNYARLLADHVALSAALGTECTVACIDVPRQAARHFGVIAVDAERRISDWIEKPEDPPRIEGRPDSSLASMGIYVFNAAFLYAELDRDQADADSGHDFGRDILPRLVQRGLAAAHPFEMSCVSTRPGQQPYWRDVGSLDAYWDANIDLTATEPQLNLYDESWPIWTYQAQLPPAKFVHNEPARRGAAVESLVSGGSIISGAIFRSVLFNTVRVHSWSSVEWSVVLPGVQVCRHARIVRAVIDRDCVIPEGMQIGVDAALDAARFHRTESGITLVTRSMLARL